MKLSVALRIVTILTAGVTAIASPSAALAASPTLVFAKVPSDGMVEHVAERYGDLLKALSKAIGVPVTFQARGSYEEVSAAMAGGRFDIVSAGPALYVDHEDRYEPIVRPLRYGRANYRGIILVPQDSRTQSLKDLRGRRLGFVSRASTSGYLLPALMLEGAGLSLERDFPAPRFYAGSHAEAARSVTRGEVDAAAVYDDARISAFGNNRAAHERTRILAHTPWVPNDPIMVLKGMDPALKRRISAFFESCAGPADAPMLERLDEGVVGWVRTDAKDYDLVRRYRAAFAEAEGASTKGRGARK